MLSYKSFNNLSEACQKSILKPVKTPEEIAKKHGVSLEQIHKQLEKGIKVEHEHTTDNETATHIALHHLWELPDYYTRLKKVEMNESIVSRVKTVGRNVKRAVGHSLPNPVRSAMAATGVTGMIHNTDKTPQEKENLQRFRGQLFSGKHKLPKFPTS